MSIINSRALALHDELEVANRLICQGLRIMYENRYQYNYFNVPLFLLSSGFERLIKSILCIIFFDEELNLSEKPFSYKGTEGHNLAILLQRLVAILKKRKYDTKFPAAEKDVRFLINNPHLTKIVELFSNYGKGARYHNIDVLLFGKSRYPNTNETWVEIENSIIDYTKAYEHGINPEIFREIVDNVTLEFIKILERFVRALSRLLTLGDLGKIGKSASVYLKHFLFLTDSDLGKSDYSKLVEVL